MNLHILTSFSHWSSISVLYWTRTLAWQYYSLKLFFMKFIFLIFVDWTAFRKIIGMLWEWWTGVSHFLVTITPYVSCLKQQFFVLVFPINTSIMEFCGFSSSVHALSDAVILIWEKRYEAGFIQINIRLPWNSFNFIIILAFNFWQLLICMKWYLLSFIINYRIISTISYFSCLKINILSFYPVLVHRPRSGHKFSKIALKSFWDRVFHFV